jgi:hypothetical protein
MFRFIFITRKFCGKKCNSNAEICIIITDQKFENDVILGYDIYLVPNI